MVAVPCLAARSICRSVSTIPASGSGRTASGVAISLLPQPISVNATRHFFHIATAVSHPSPPRQAAKEMPRRSYPRGMRYSFYARAPRPRWSDVTEALGLADLRCVEDAPLGAAAWLDGYFHFFREGISTRSVEV